MITCYFSATGNSLYAARRIGGRLLSIPQLMRQDEIELTDDAVGIVCPVYCSEMPMMVRAFLEKAKITTEYFFFVFTYGISESVAPCHAAEAAEAAELTLSYVNAVEMTYNYLPGCEMEAEIRKAEKKDIDRHLDEICRDISARKIRTVKVGVLKKKAMAFIHRSTAEQIMIRSAAQSFHTGPDCTRCGTCAKVCPAGNITVGAGVSFGDRCEVCFACLHNCPQQALHLDAEKSSARFRNPHVSLQDLEEANDQEVS